MKVIKEFDLPDNVKMTEYGECTMLEVRKLFVNNLDVIKYVKKNNGNIKVFYKSKSPFKENIEIAPKHEELPNKFICDKCNKELKSRHGLNLHQLRFCKGNYES